MDVQLLGAHNCESASTRLSGILIDDKIAVDAGSLTSSLSLDAQEQLEAVLLTHQHYDHIRDILALAMNTYLAGNTVNIYSIEPVYNVLDALFESNIYHNFMKRPEENPAVNFTIIEPQKSILIGGYEILAVTESHSVPAVGYQVTSPDGKVLYFTGDTGQGLKECWEQISPQLLIIECTACNSFNEFGKRAGHMTPALLKEELISFREIKGYLPRVVTVHMSPRLEEEIKPELAAVSEELNSPILMGYEGMQLQL
ncbi:MBL fold metallo-hydrolase [Chloroflexota bacterium]